MWNRFTHWLHVRVTFWLTREQPPADTPLCDFQRLSYELRPGDVVLVEGRSRVADVIKIITQSPWTHSALYLGRFHDIEDPRLRARILRFFDGPPSEQLVLEALMEKGTVITPLKDYARDHLRICRPRSLEPQDAQQVIAFSLNHLGARYDTRQLLDLARFLFPWAVLPRRWRSSLFEHNAGGPTRTVCSTLIAEAFNRVNYPILPFVKRDGEGRVRLYKRNPRLFSPRDFDYSPYFDIIKYPYLGIEELAAYQRLPWDQEQIYNEPNLVPKVAPKPASKSAPKSAKPKPDPIQTNPLSARLRKAVDSIRHGKDEPKRASLAGDHHG